MINNQGTIQKMNCVLAIPAATGVLSAENGPSEFACHAETRIRVETTGSGVVVVEGRIINSGLWTAITLTNSVGDISTFDYVRFRVGTAGTAGQLIASGFLSFI